MIKFKCWDNSNTDEDGAGTYEAYDAETAAELFANDELNNSGGDCGSYIPAHVRLPDGALEIYDVTIDYEPTFRAVKREPSPPSGGLE